MMIIKNEYEIGQTVFLITDGEQLPRLVVSLIVNKFDILYKVCNGITTSEHYDFEMSENKVLQTM